MNGAVFPHSFGKFQYMVPAQFREQFAIHPSENDNLANFILFFRNAPHIKK